jgi:hypothetical protein
MMFGAAVSAQNIKGKVYIESLGESLPGATVYWQDGSKNTQTDTSGFFEISLIHPLPQKLIISFTGFLADTITVESLLDISVKLKEQVSLKELEIEGSSVSILLNKMSTVNMQTITVKELAKAACCNLSESFETNASVDVNFTNAATGARQIQMLGLDGVYSQILSENFPAIRGLSASYGLGFIPGPWINSIQISKGVGSVVNGYESVTGLINLEYLKPDDASKWFFNGYLNHQGRAELNVHRAGKLNSKWSTMLLAHGSSVNFKNDFNKDDFMDQPLSKQLNVFNRWKYKSERIVWQLGLKAVHDGKTGGQLKFDDKRDYFTTNNFGIGIKTRQYEGFSKLGFLFPKTPYRGLGIITNVRKHNIDSYYGFKTYTGNEDMAYVNVIYQDIIGNTNHSYKAGLSYLYDNFKQYYGAMPFNRKESVPGAYAEYTYTKNQRFNSILGFRADYHNLYGWLLNPRLHVKLDVFNGTSLRLAAGTGTRVANILVENASILASARTLYVMEKLLPEKAMNAGASLTQTFSLLGRDASLVIDYFYTHFLNQVIADLDVSARKVIVHNLRDKSYSGALQTEFNYELIKHLDLRIAYKYYDVKAMYNGFMQDRPFISKHRAFVNFAYATQYDIWKFDLTAKWFGLSRIPSTEENVHQYHTSTSAPPYYLLNAQITKAFKKFEIYLGAENILNYMQHMPVIAADQPFSPYFDASMIWGPTMGSTLYLGFRMTIK